MAEDHFPQHPVARPNHPPEYGQIVPYVYEDGDRYPAIIHLVGAHSEDGKYYNVVISVLHEPVGDGKYAGEVHRIVRVYWKDTGIMTSDPCGPPWPG